MFKLFILLIVLVVLVLNILVFDLARGEYYFLNSSIMSAFILLSYILDAVKKELPPVQLKIKKVVLMISLLCIIGQTVVTFIMAPLRMNDNLIAVFSFVNTILFIFHIFKFEFKRV